jgi:hypothetical protein
MQAQRRAIDAAFGRAIRRPWAAPTNGERHQSRETSRLDQQRIGTNSEVRQLALVGANSKFGMEWSSPEEVSKPTIHGEDCDVTGTRNNLSKSPNQLLRNGISEGGRKYSTGTAQRMVERDGKEITDTRNYYIEISNRNSLYVAEGATPPLHTGIHFANTGEVNIFGDEYDDARKYLKYRPSANFGILEKPNDCAMYADALRTGQPTWLPYQKGKNGLEYKPRADFQPDGLDGADSDPSIRAQLGEMYHIQWQGGKPDTESAKANHHAATVIVQDGNDEITSEAHADLKTLKAPIFKMYGTSENSFYDQSADYFTYAQKNKDEGKDEDKGKGKEKDEDEYEDQEEDKGSGKSIIRPYMAIAPRGDSNTK